MGEEMSKVNSRAFAVSAATISGIDAQLPPNDLRLLNMIRGRLGAEEIRSDSDDALHAGLHECVAGRMLLIRAKQFRDAGHWLVRGAA